MSALNLRFNQIIVPPGNQITLRDIDWSMFENILQELGDKRGSRLTYNEGILDIMAPLAWHEDSKNIIASLIEILLEEMDIEFRALGSTTFKNKTTGKAVEPDECFYIEHESIIRGKARIDLEQDPPPDIILEIDLTSHTNLDVYSALNMPEVWCYENDKLSIAVLRQGKYENVATSPHFPGLDLLTAIPKFLIDSRINGRTKAIRGFRTWVKNAMKNGGTEINRI